jgi:hypothetical protein
MWPGERAARRKRRENEEYLSRQIHPQSTLHNRESARGEQDEGALNELLGHIFSYLPATRGLRGGVQIKCPCHTTSTHTRNYFSQSGLFKRIWKKFARARHSQKASRNNEMRPRPPASHCC